MSTKAEKAESLDTLRRLLPRGAILVAVRRGPTSRSGSFPADFMTATRDPKTGNLTITGYVTWHIRVLFGYREQRRSGAVILPFMNMDPGFATADALSHKLWPGEYSVSASETKNPDRRGLRSEWL